LPRIRPLSPEKLVKILEKIGFRTVRQKGSHIIMINGQGTRIVIPVHPGRDIKPGLVRAIVKEAGLNRERFFRLLRGV